MKLFKIFSVILVIYVGLLLAGALTGALYFHNRDLGNPSSDFGVGTVSFYFYVTFLLALFNTWTFPLLTLAFYALIKYTRGKVDSKFMKVGKRVLCTVYGLHFAIMLPLYFHSLDVFGLWDFYYENDLAHIYFRSLLDVTIALGISFLFVYSALHFFDRDFIARFRYPKAISFTLFGIYFFYLSGQSIIVSSPENRTV